jgi:hypothetical protein
VAEIRLGVRHVVRGRFGTVPALEERIEAAGAAELAAMLDRLLAGAGPDDL